MIAFLRLAIAIVVFLMGVVAIIPAQTYNLWKLSILASELGWIVAIVALLPLLPGWRRTTTGRVSAVLAACAVLMLLSPLVRAMPVAANLQRRLDEKFGQAKPRSLRGAHPRDRAFSLTALARAPQSPPVSKTRLTYVARQGAPLQLDLYRSRDTIPPAPAIVVIHGGSWQGGGRADLPLLNEYIAARGYVVAAISYRLAPTSPHPAATEDVNAAIDHLKSNASRLGIDATRIVLVGRSAGGQLALLSAYTKNDPSIRGVVAFYPPTDQIFGYENPSNPRVLNSTAVLEGYLAGNPTTAPEAYQSSSPLNYVGPHTIPTLLIHGTKDELIWSRQSQRLADRLAAAKRPHMYLELPWATHGCDYFPAGPCGQISTFAIERFLAAVTR